MLCGCAFFSPVGSLASPSHTNAPPPHTPAAIFSTRSGAVVTGVVAQQGMAKGVRVSKRHIDVTTHVFLFFFSPSLYATLSFSLVHLHWWVATL